MRVAGLTHTVTVAIHHQEERVHSHLNAILAETRIDDLRRTAAQERRGRKLRSKAARRRPLPPARHPARSGGRQPLKGVPRPRPSALRRHAECGGRARIAVGPADPLTTSVSEFPFV